MQNPLEKFLLNLAEKIQTEKEYKEIVSNSQSVDVNKDVFAGFIEGIAKTIRENVKVPVLSAGDNQPSQPDPLDKFLVTLKDKLKEVPAKKKETIIPAVSSVPVETTTQPAPEKDAFEGFVNNLADIIKKEKTKPRKKTAKVVTDEDNEERKTETKTAEEPVDDYVKILSTDKKKDKDKEEDDEEDELKSFVSTYVSKELTSFQKEMAEKFDQLQQAVEKEMMDDGSGDGGGGGDNSYNYYPGGGPMYGNLQFPVSGTGILFYDGTLLTSASGVGGGGGGGGGGDPAVNTVVYNNSANWISNYTTSSYFSAFWNAAVDELFTFYVTQTPSASAFWTEDGNYYFIQNSKLDNWQLWNSMYTTLYLNSAGWESTESNVNASSASWNSVYTSINANTGKYESVYTTYNQNSASYATEILAIAYAVAL